MEKKIDFGKVVVKDIEGNSQEMDVRKPLGNDIYLNAQDIAVADLGRKIYHSEGELTLTDDEAGVVLQATQQWRWYIRSAIEELLK